MSGVVGGTCSRRIKVSGLLWGSWVQKRLGYGIFEKAISELDSFLARFGSKNLFWSPPDPREWVK